MLVGGICPYMYIKCPDPTLGSRPIFSSHASLTHDMRTTTTSMTRSYVGQLYTCVVDCRNTVGSGSHSAGHEPNLSNDRVYNYFVRFSHSISTHALLSLIVVYGKSKLSQKHLRSKL